MATRDRRGSQLSVELPPELLARLRAHAAAADRPVAAVVRRWIEAGLSGALEAGAAAPAAGDLADRVAALEAAVAQLQAQPSRSLQRVRPSTPPAGEAPSLDRVSAAPRTGESLAPSGALTTAELADRLRMKRGSLNERIRRAGGARVGLVMEGWRLVGEAPAPGGGPLRKLWEPA
jgi:hypothetical protein